ncbi:hypothetical protein phage protein [Xanthomonas phage Xp15]|uniref:Uncharacterized protein n=1 Tax=Xanthomonas phage Xp15 TaxID=322855 RepID=Q52PL0_9CAUD|nr:minor tail protein [Xanthomonas phage Xp15]AAX84918.1 hypothetical protein phage protein [Xanthomonas phage Xp15]
MSTFKERKQRVRDPSGLLILMELSANSFQETLRIANDTDNWTSNGLLYYGFPFKFTGPDDSDGSNASSKIVIDNTGRGMSDDLESLQPNEIILVKLMITDFYNPSAIIRTLYLPMMGATIRVTQMEGRCGVDYIMRQRSVQLASSPYTAPGSY